MALDPTPAPPSPTPLNWRKLVWAVLLVVLSPLGLVYLIARLAKGKSLRGFAERLGVLPATLAQLHASGEPVVWIHAVSAGEVAAMEPIIRELRLAEPHLRIALSTITATGRHMAERPSLEVDAVFFFPLDFPGIVEHVLDVVRPDLIVVAETELWPYLAATAAERGIPLTHVNARLSDRSFGTYRAARLFTSWVLGNIRLICAQSELDRERFVAVGADPARVEVLGNSKFDEDFPEVPPEEAAKWRQDLGFDQDQPVLLAASTHPGEEEKVLQVYHSLRDQFPQLGLLLAPRHPERGDAVAKLIGEFGYACLRRSRTREADEAGPATPDARVQVALLDTIGELSRVYSIADVVFMGGSLVPVGGHNFLQPMALGKPVIFGPHMNNSRDLTELVLREGAAMSVRTEEELATAVTELLQSEGQRDLLSVRARALLQRNSGAARATVQRLLPLLNRHARA
ncbi:MAG TPA: 3-deoxy-D-manno-octulosonic acid transferase [Armatimonadota bacterium]|jgi:3-deoxy-D-manno-octulosonic-acid transferase